MVRARVAEEAALHEAAAARAADFRALAMFLFAWSALKLRVDAQRPGDAVLAQQIGYTRNGSLL